MNAAHYRNDGASHWLLNVVPSLIKAVTSLTFGLCVNAITLPRLWLSSTSPMALLVVLLTCSALPYLCCASPRFFSVDGHVSHGINTFNDEPIVDLSASSAIFSSFGRIYEIGVLNQDGTNASVITARTPPSALMATIDAFDYQNSLRFPAGVGPFNIPIADAPALTILSQNLNDRVPPNSFADSADPAVIGLPYLSRESDAQITLADWNRMSARIVGKCFNNSAKVKIVVRNALPNGLYTLWDVGVTNPLTEDEGLSAGPFGGLPNVIVTNQRGYGSIFRNLNYCPSDKCAGSRRCTLYVSLFYHFDHMVYGGSPALDFAGQAIGHAAANQIQLFLNGELLIPPQNAFATALKVV
eukprot:TRINITY_DN55465_c0_g1_i1.p2 TRINITY_DN55465_c0_g1~~TRINITY_DN55465_c0_g1_i1.p2  ORF type:complete len:356 (+),score=54.41 TRINITY_DN55465_c0_g1_i1:1972-3039(+)